jgi:hypothetical protein
MIVYGANGIEVYHATPDSDVDPGQLLKSLTKIAARSPSR